MELADKIWIETLANTALKKPASPHVQSLIQKAALLFLEEISSIMMNYVLKFNEMVTQEDNSLCCQIFKLGAPHPRIILSKGTDKMIISVEGKVVQVRVLQVNFNSERTLQTLHFKPEFTQLGPILWRNSEDSQCVNPKLVAQNYLASFLVSGCKSFIPPFPRLVAVECDQERSCS